MCVYPLIEIVTPSNVTLLPQGPFPFSQAMANDPYHSLLHYFVRFTGFLGEPIGEIQCDPTYINKEPQ